MTEPQGRLCTLAEVHPLGEHLVVGHPCTGKVHVLNPLAAVVLDAVAGPAVPGRSAVVRAVSAATGLAATEAARHAADALDQLAGLGLLGDHPPASAPPPPVCPPLERPGGAGGHGPLAALGYRFWIHADGEGTAGLAAAVAGAFAAADPADPLEGCGQDHRYDLVELGDGVRVLADGAALGVAADVQAARGLVRNHVHRAAVTHAGSLPVLHAAAVRRDGAVVALVGDRGAGKSTLAASLAAAGWEHAADEVVAVDGTDGTCVPVPGLVNLKPGSRPLFDAAPAAGEADPGRWSVLYDPVDLGPHAWERHQRRWPLAAVVLPAWAEGAELEVTRLEPPDVVTALVHNSFPTGRLPDLGPLVALAAHLPAWRLTHGDHHDARTAIDDLLTGVPAPRI